MLPFDVSYQADVWGRVRKNVESYREQAQASAADLATVNLSMHADLAVDYFQARSLDAEEQLLNSTVKQYEQALELNRKPLPGRDCFGSGSRAGEDSTANDPSSSDRCGRAARAVRTRGRDSDWETSGGVQPSSAASHRTASAHSYRLCPRNCWKDARISQPRRGGWRPPTPRSELRSRPTTR